MKSFKSALLLSTTLLLSCSTPPTKVTEGTRSIASINVSKEDLSDKQVKKTIKGILHSYILGQVLLQKFDKKLDKDVSNVMESDEYHQLMAIRTAVDAHEENINNLYTKLVLVRALPHFDQDQKNKAQTSLNIIGQFMDGITDDKDELPENLKHLVLSNLREKQTELFDELKSIESNPEITNNDPEALKVLHENMVLLRATRMKYFKEIKNYKVDQQLLDEAVEKYSKDLEFNSFKRSIRRSAKEMKKLSEKVTNGRSTSSDVIYPTAAIAGNITGNGFPTNTWSVTYDDGPGGKTSPTVLKNLQDKGLKATFFMLAKQVEALPTTAKSIADAGMDIACHSYDHQQMTKLGPIGLEKQIPGAKKIIETKLGKEIKLFRLPYGAGVSVSSIRTKIAEANMIHVFWNVDTLDWQDKNPTSIFNRAVKQMLATTKKAGIVLFHDIHPQSVIASAMLLDYMKEKNINVCTVQGVVDQLNKGLTSCQP